MGDRANVKLVDRDSTVFLYTHWGGMELPQALQKALRKRWRWEDGQYLARIVFDVMTNGAHGDETGFGISSVCGDGADRILELNTEQQTVTMWMRGRVGGAWTFEEFCALDTVGWGKA